MEGGGWERTGGRETAAVHVVGLGLPGTSFLYNNGLVLRRVYFNGE